MLFSGLFNLGFLEIKFNIPAIAPPPYKVELAPFTNSICCKSKGGICKILKLPAYPPNKGIPSLKICVYFPCKPCMRISALPVAALVCCI